MQPFVDRVDAPGDWRSNGDLIVNAPFDAVVEELDVRLGDPVAAGRVLARLETRESRAALRGAELMVREARDPAARAEATRALALAQRDRVHVPLIAAKAGVVSKVAVTAGAEVAQAAEILTIVPEGAIVFQAKVSPLEAPKVHGGQIGVVVDADGQRHAVRVQRVLPIGTEGDPSTLVMLTPAAGPAGIQINQFGTASIEVGTPRRSRAVPDSALVEDDLTGTRRIAVVNQDSRAHWVVAEIGVLRDGWRELKAPALPPGTRVVVQGQRGLPDSTRVRVAP
jgi:multidrug efflux pump subunit AcrA (membrane-fusion protein)